MWREGRLMRQWEEALRRTRVNYSTYRGKPGVAVIDRVLFDD